MFYRKILFPFGLATPATVRERVRPFRCEHPQRRTSKGQLKGHPRRSIIFLPAFPSFLLRRCRRATRPAREGQGGEQPEGNRSPRGRHPWNV